MQALPSTQQQTTAEPYSVEQINASIQPNNRLLIAATSLLTLITQIRHTVKLGNIAKFRSQVIDEIKAFIETLARERYPTRMVRATHYCLCAAFDEAVLSRTWADNSIWMQQSLLSIFFSETWGGERFYVIVDAFAKDPRQHIDFLEFAYVLLSLGFEGKYYDQQKTMREEIRSRVFYRIRHARKKPNRQLSTLLEEDFSHYMPVGKRRRIKRLSIFTLTILGVVSIIFNVMVRSDASQVLAKLNQIGRVSPVTVFSQVIQRPIVKRGLQPWK